MKLDTLKAEILLILNDKKQHNTYIQNAEMGKRILLVKEILSKRPKLEVNRQGNPHHNNVSTWCYLHCGMNKWKVRKCIETYETAAMLICSQPARRRGRRNVK